MKLMFPKRSFVGVVLTLIILTLSSAAVPAQSRKAKNDKKAAAEKAKAKKADAKKAEAKTKDAKKDRDKRRDKDSARDKRKDSKANAEKLAERRKAEAERRRIAEERRQALIAERRRREQAAREARERKIAFERGLRTQTVENIAKDVTDGEDLNVRRAAINALGEHAGSVVVMEAQTGKVLTIVNQDWAVRSSIRPCSTIKLVTGVAALNEGVISKETGSIRNTPTRRLLDDAIAFSDNKYFQKAGAQLGNTKLVEYGRRLGLGEPTGLNMEGEVPGRLPVSNNNARIYSHGDDTEVSTIQLAVLASEITNGGHRVLPRIPRNNIEKADFRTFYKANVDLPAVNMRRVIPGMMGAAEYGTAHRNMDQNLGVAGKTGSCIDKGSWVGLFASVAPIENPKYAVAVITRGQRERGKYAAAVAADVYRALAAQIVRTDRNLAQTEFKIAPKNSVDIATAAKTADAADENEENDAAEDDQNPNGRNVVVVTQVEKNAPKKLVTRTGNSRPLFPPVIITFDRDGNPIPKP